MVDKKKRREAIWADIQRRNKAGRKLMHGDTVWLFEEVGLLREELVYWEVCAEQNNRETNEQRAEVERLNKDNEVLARGCTLAQQTYALSLNDIVALTAEVERLTAASVVLKSVDAAIRDYHYALDTRQHGGVAQDVAVTAIEKALRLPWEPQKERKRREPAEPAQL